MKQFTKKSCLYIIIFAAVALILAICAPYIVASQSTTNNIFTTSLFGDFKVGIQSFGAMMADFEGSILGIMFIFNMMFNGMLNYGAHTEIANSGIGLIAPITAIVFIVIVAIDIALAVLMLLTKRNEKVRKVCKVLSMVMGVVMCFIFAIFLIFSIGSLFTPMHGMNNADPSNIKYFYQFDQYVLLANLFCNGFIWAAICAIVSGILISKQFKWFSKAY